MFYINEISAWILPTVALGIVLWGFFKGIKVFDCFISGVKNSMKTVISVLPPLIALMLCVTALRESGALDAAVRVVGGAAEAVGIPRGVLPLMAVSPVSGSGSITVFEQILSQFGADSFEGRVASVIMCSTETTFYAVTVYYGSVGVSKTRCTVPAAVTADITCFICSAWAVRLIM